MMTAHQQEMLPDSYAAIDVLGSDELAIAWQRIERYIAFRYSPREVVWRVLSDGCDWHPPLAPVVSLTVSTGGETPYEPAFGSMGGYVLPSGIVTVTAIVGAGPVPAAVAEAIKRLAEYYASEKPMPTGARSYSASVGQLSESMIADPAHLGRAIQNSGAADLLRAYRKAPAWG